MKAVLISIRSEWCELIASGEKTIEMRKTRPKLKTPFKCYIYQTKHRTGNGPTYSDGKVIGEFVCDEIIDISISCSDPDMKGILLPYTGLTDRQIMDYLGNGKTGYGWHISDLKIYDEPKKISDFWRLCTEYNELGPNCWDCENVCGDDEVDCNTNGRLYLTRAPQSWCYVEEVSP